MNDKRPFHISGNYKLVYTVVCPNSLFIVVFGWTKNHSQAYEYMPSDVSYKWKLSKILYFLLHAFDIYFDSLIFVVSAR